MSYHWRSRSRAMGGVSVKHALGCIALVVECLRVGGSSCLSIMSSLAAPMLAGFQESFFGLAPLWCLFRLGRAREFAGTSRHESKRESLFRSPKLWSPADNFSSPVGDRGAYRTPRAAMLLLFRPPRANVWHQQLIRRLISISAGAVFLMAGPHAPASVLGTSLPVVAPPAPDTGRIFCVCFAPPRWRRLCEASEERLTTTTLLSTDPLRAEVPLAGGCRLSVQLPGSAMAGRRATGDERRRFLQQRFFV